MIAVCWIGDINLPISFLDGDRNNLTRRNISYLIDEDDIEYEVNGTFIIGGQRFFNSLDFNHYYVSEAGIVFSVFYRKFMHKKIAKDPYYCRISVVNNYGVRETKALHRIVYYAVNHLSENPLMEVNHIDGRPWNNDAHNLEELSKLDNIRHAMYVIKTHNVLWSPLEIDTICKMLDSGKTIAEVYSEKWISDKIGWDGFKILAHHIIHHSKFWRDISSKYDFHKWKKATQLYSDDTVRNICILLEQGLPQTDISKRLNVPLKYISQVKNRDVRTRISKDYTF